MGTGKGEEKKNSRKTEDIFEEEENDHVQNLPLPLLLYCFILVSGILTK